MTEPISEETERVATEVVDSALRVHRELGPGLLESVYEACLAHELSKRGLSVARQVTLPVMYDSQEIAAGLRLDMVVDDRIVIEVKAAEKIAPIFRAQLLTYLKLSGMRLGFLINFNVPLIRDGIVRLAL